MIDWTPVLERAVAIVLGYDTPPTLRQLYYRLVSEGLIPNREGAYKGLSARTAEGRREGTFPALTDRTRSVSQIPAWTSPGEAVGELAESFTFDRTAGQDVQIWVAVEKDALAGQLVAWYANLGVPIFALRGYSSQTLADEIAGWVDQDGRPAILLYGGDFDPTGDDIDRDFDDRTGCWSKVVRVALTVDQIETYDLPPMPGKATDSRAGAFVERYGELVQVELDALAPDDLRALYQAAISEHWNDDAYRAVLDRETEAREVLAEIAEELEG